MVSFTLDAVKFLLIYRYLQNTYWFKRGINSFLFFYWQWVLALQWQASSSFLPITGRNYLNLQN